MRHRRVGGALAWVTGLGAVTLALLWSGRGALAPPPLGRPARWSAWLEARDPVVAAFSLLRLVALGALWYLVAVTLVGLLLRLAGAARLAAATDRVTVAPVRRLLAGVSLSLAATVVAPVAMVPAALASQPVPTSTTSTSTTTAPPTSGPPATVTMHRLGPGETAAPLPSVAEATPAVVAPASLAVTDRWTVKPGECFWTIAESVLTRTWGRAPTDAEIVPYWQRLISTNRAALGHPGDPDLIFPGQVFDVPTP